MISMDRLICFPEAAAVLGGISVRTVRRMVAAQELPQPVYLGRKPMFVLSELAEAVERFKARRKDRA